MTEAPTTEADVRVGDILIELKRATTALPEVEVALVRMLLQGLPRTTIASALGLPNRALQRHLESLRIHFEPAAMLAQESWDAMWEPGPFDAVLSAFADGWRASGGFALDHDDVEEIVRIGRQAGEQAAVTAKWRRRLGATLETQDVTELLGLSRQALDSRKRTGSVLALPGSGTSYYPAWQFDPETRPPSVRPITLRIVTAFREAVEDLSLYVVAGWATSPQPELDDRTPADWIVSGGADEPVVLAAQRAAHLEAT